MSKEPLPVKGPIYVRVKNPKDARYGQVGEWLGVSPAVLGPLVGKVLVQFPDGMGAYDDDDLEWIHDE